MMNAMPAKARATRAVCIALAGTGDVSRAELFANRAEETHSHALPPRFHIAKTRLLGLYSSNNLADNAAC